MSLFGDVIGYVQAGRAAKAVSQANNDAMQGVLSSASGAVRGVQDAVSASEGAVNDAGAHARASLRDYIGDIQGNLTPYLAGGQQGVQQLRDYAANMPQFSFNPADLENDPGYKFQRDQGLQAVTAGASPTGLGLSGNTQKALMDYSSGLAGRYYQQAFDRAKSTYDTNQNATLATLQSLIAPGIAASGQYGGAVQNLGGQEAGAEMDLQRFLAALRTGAAGTEGEFSTRAAKQAGDYRVGQGQATATGYMNQGAALSSGIGDLASLVFGGGSFGPASQMIFGGSR